MHGVHCTPAMRVLHAIYNLINGTIFQAWPASQVRTSLCRFSTSAAIDFADLWGVMQWVSTPSLPLTKKTSKSMFMALQTLGNNPTWLHEIITIVKAWRSHVVDFLPMFAFWWLNKFNHHAWLWKLIIQKLQNIAYFKFNFITTWHQLPTTKSSFRITWFHERIINGPPRTFFVLA